MNWSLNVVTQVLDGGFLVRVNSGERARHAGGAGVNECHGNSESVATPGALLLVCVGWMVRSGELECVDGQREHHR